VKLLNKLDFAPGWKAAALGAVAALVPFLEKLLVYLGYPPIPKDLLLSGQTLLLALIGLAVALKIQRSRG